MSKAQPPSDSAIRTLREALLAPGYRPPKPRSTGATIMLDTGIGVRQVDDLCETSGDFIDYAKIAWGSALITANLEHKLERYQAFGVTPLLGGTLFEYAHLRSKVEALLDFVRDTKIPLEISDGCIELDRKEKLRWIERFAAHTTVLSEVGGKVASQDLDWIPCCREELEAGSHHVVIEGREIGPVGQEIRVDLVRELIEGVGAEKLFFEALERKQQVWLIKEVGPNVNLGNIRSADVATLEAFRQGLKEHTLLFTAERQRL